MLEHGVQNLHVAPRMLGSLPIPDAVHNASRRGIKKCSLPAEGLDFREVIPGPFRTVFGVPRPLEVGGLRPPTFPGTSLLGLRSIFSIFDINKFEAILVSGARFLIPKFLIRPAGCIVRTDDGTAV